MKPVLIYQETADTSLYLQNKDGYRATQQGVAIKINDRLIGLHFVRDRIHKNGDKAVNVHFLFCAPWWPIVMADTTKISDENVCGAQTERTSD